MRDALALALVHFIWQGAVLAAAGALLMRITKVPSVRYAIGVATMMAMLLAPVLTFLAIQKGLGASPLEAAQTSAFSGNPAAVAATDVINPAPGNWAMAPGGLPRLPDGFVVPTTWILTVWTIGVLLLSLRFLGGWAVARRFATQTLAPVGDDLQAVAVQLAARLKVRGGFRVCESASVAVPMMIGWLRPVIVLPPAALVVLPLSQLEALLAHELAHIRRHDYLVNLLQTGVETLCFYHPAVWWMSREVRRHREDCCDDVAVGVCDRLTYVTALSSLASIATPQFAMSATGGSLRDRVRRLIQPSTHSASPKGAWIAMLPILLVVSFAVPHAWVAQAARPAAPAAPVEVAAEEAQAVEERRIMTARQSADVERRQTAREVERARAVERAVEAEARRNDIRQVDPAREVKRDVERALEQSRARESVRATEVREMTREAQQVVERRRAQREAQLRETLPEVEEVLLENRLRQQEQALARRQELFDRGLATRSALQNSQEEVQATRRHLEASRLRHNPEEREVGISRSETVHRERELLDAATTLQSSDHLTISVAGEPELPTAFMVRSDGSIRFPFLGAIRVQGSTVSEVRTAIQKLIADKGLARNAAVTVSASRPR